MDLQRKQKKLTITGSYAKNVSEQLIFLMEGIEEYNFDIENFDKDLLISMTRDEVLSHLYHILLNFIEADNYVS